MKAKLLKLLENSPLIKEAEENEAKRLLETRTKSARKIQALETERASKIKELQADLSCKIEEYEQVQSHCDILVDGVRQAQLAIANENGSADHAIGQEKAYLLSTYNKSIDEAVGFFRKKLDWLRKPGRISQQHSGSAVDLVSFTKETIMETNRPALLAALSYCQFALKQLDRMKLEPSVDILWIESLKAGIPSIDIYSDIEGKKPMPAGQETLVPPPNWEIADLNRRADDVIYDAEYFKKRLAS